MANSIPAATLQVTEPFKIIGFNGSYTEQEAGFRALLHLPGQEEREIAIWHTGPGKEYQASDPNEKYFKVINVEDAENQHNHLADKVRFYVNDLLIDQISALGAPTLITREQVTVEIVWKIGENVRNQWKKTDGTLRAQLLPPEANHKQFDFEREENLHTRNDEEENIQQSIEEAKEAKKPPPVFQLKTEPLLNEKGTAPIGLQFCEVNDPQNLTYKLTYDETYQRWQVQPFFPNGSHDRLMPVRLWNGDQEISDWPLERIVNLPAITIKPFSDKVSFGRHVQWYALTIPASSTPPANSTTSSSAADKADNSLKDNSTTTPAAPKKWYQTGIVGWFVDLLGKLAHLFCFWRKSEATPA